jgi:hypothetical protein
MRDLLINHVSYSFPYLQLVLFFHLLLGSPVAESLLAAGAPGSFLLNSFYEAAELRL